MLYRYSREAGSGSVTETLPEGLHCQNPRCGVLPKMAYALFYAMLVACQSSFCFRSPRTSPERTALALERTGTPRIHRRCGRHCNWFPFKKNIYFLNLVTKVMHIVWNNLKNRIFFFNYTLSHHHWKLRSCINFTGFFLCKICIIYLCRYIFFTKKWECMLYWNLFSFHITA